MSNLCLEAENKGDENNPIYSCTKCEKESVKIINKKNSTNCFGNSENLAFCSEGVIDDKETTKCNKCIANAYLNKSNNHCKCDSDSFNPYLSLSRCYKCDDYNYDINLRGCDASKGCQYNNTSSNINLVCNKCKDDSFVNEKGQCISCLQKLEYCNKCKIEIKKKIENETEKEEFKCEDCIDRFVYNNDEKYCELFYEECPQIALGCYVFNDEYKSKSKCHYCKPGYFKTKDESCIFCREEKYGGPACDKCGYNIDENGKETNEIKCLNCTGEYKVLNSEGKCYNCKNELSDKCQRCKFVKNGNKEELKCTLCIKGYYLDSNGKCISFLDNIEKIPNCRIISFKIGNISCKYYPYNDNIYYEINDIYNNYYLWNNSNDSYANYINENLKEIKSSIKGICVTPDDGYYLNDINYLLNLN